MEFKRLSIICFSTIKISRLKVVAFVAIRPSLSAHGRQRTLPTEQFRLIFLKNTLYPISSKNQRRLWNSLLISLRQILRNRLLHQACIFQIRITVFLSEQVDNPFQTFCLAIFPAYLAIRQKAITFFAHTVPPIISLAMLTSSFSLASSFSAISFPCAVMWYSFFFPHYLHKVQSTSCPAKSLMLHIKCLLLTKAARPFFFNKLHNGVSVFWCIKRE